MKVRAGGKRLLGAQVTQEIHSAVDEWLRQNPRKTVTDFLVEAAMEKLDAEKIPYDKEAAIIDGRRRIPGKPVSFALPPSGGVNSTSSPNDHKSGTVLSKEAKQSAIRAAMRSVRKDADAAQVVRPSAET